MILVPERRETEVAILRRHFGLRGVVHEKASKDAAAPEIRSVAPAARFTWKQIRTGLVIAGLIFIVSTKLLWSYYQYQVLENASPQARKACAGASLKSPSRDAYYYCIQRVEAGGQP